MAKEQLENQHSEGWIQQLMFIKSPKTWYKAEE